MPDLSFTESEKVKIKKTTELYLLFKDLLIEAEELDDERKTQPQILLEVRNALEHLMRVLIMKFAPANEQSDGYFKQALDKFHGHVYRAGYDVLDWQAIVLRGKIISELRRFSHEAIEKVLPDYYPTIRPGIEQISIDIASIRAKKDVDGPADADFENFKKYADKVRALQSAYRTKILPSISPITDLHKRMRKDEIWKTYLPWILSGVLGVLTLVFGLT